MSKKQFSLGPTDSEVIERFRYLKGEHAIYSGGATNESFISFLMDTAEELINQKADAKREARKYGLRGKPATEQPENDEQEINLDAIEGMTDEEVEAYLRGEKTGNQEN